MNSATNLAVATTTAKPFERATTLTRTSVDDCREARSTDEQLDNAAGHVLLPSRAFIAKIARVLEADPVEGLTAVGYLDGLNLMGGIVTERPGGDPEWDAQPDGVTAEQWSEAMRRQIQMLIGQFLECNKPEFERCFQGIQDAAARSQNPDSEFATVWNARLIVLEVVDGFDRYTGEGPAGFFEHVADVMAATCRIYNLTDAQNDSIRLAAHALQIVQPVPYKDSAAVGEEAGQ